MRAVLHLYLKEVLINMSILSGIEPKPVFHFFEEICKIPHGSGNEEQLSNYLKAFADERGLFCIQDDHYNIIIVKEAAAGYEEEEPLILQGHMDMVAVKEEGFSIDMKKEPLHLQKEGDFVSAKGTSLGGDDGIAVAYLLALLDSKEIAHPRLEAILTVGEETGMEGAREIDVSMLQGKRMLNLDNEEEGVLLVSCAGGARADCKLPVLWEERCGEVLHVQVGGLCGGHSGVEIIKERGNANCLMGRILDALVRKAPVSLMSLEGGLADNAIPRQADARLVVREEDLDVCVALIREVEEQIRRELAGKDDGVRILAEVENADLDGEAAIERKAGEAEQKEKADKPGKTWKCLQEDSMRKAVAYLTAMPNGVQAMSIDVEGLVETSLNLGVMKLSGEYLSLSFAIRSSLESAKKAMCGKLQAISYLAGASVEIRGDYPGWAYRKNSPLRDKMIRIYEEMYNAKPEIEAIHAGLECGLFAGKIPGLDCVSCGPDMKAIHTAEEVLSISSVKRVWEYLLEILKQK